MFGKKLVGLLAFLLLAGCTGPGTLGFYPEGPEDYEKILQRNYDSAHLKDIRFVGKFGDTRLLEFYAGKIVILHGTKSGFGYSKGHSLGQFLELQKKLSGIPDVAFINVFSNQFKRPGQHWRRDARTLGWSGETYEVNEEEGDRLFGGRYLFVFRIFGKNGNVLYKTSLVAHIDRWDNFIRHVLKMDL